MAYHPAFRGGVQVATGDVNADGVLDIITAPGAGGGPHIRVFDGATGEPLPGVIGNFMAYSPLFTGGVYVAAGDINGDGHADIVTTPGEGGGPHVRIFSGRDGSVLGEYFVYNPGFLGGVRAAVGDVNGDGTPDVITGAGPGGGPHVRVMSGATASQIEGPLGSFFVYNPGFLGGIYVAAGDLDGDGRADVITGAGAGGGPHVRALSGADGAELASFFAYNLGFTGGIRVAAGDFDDDGLADIITGAGVGGGPHVRAIRGTDRAELASFFAYEPTFTGGVHVAGSPAGVGGSALHAFGGSTIAGLGTSTLSQAQLDAVVAAAIGRLEGLGLGASAADRLRKLRFRVDDLAGDLLGLSYRDLALIDADGAGHGWFVDPTPNESEEFVHNGVGTGAAADAVDLVSAVSRSLGHALGLPEDLGVMADDLAEGIRRTLGEADIDTVFSDGLWE
jgi:hypothetical protein